MGLLTLAAFWWASASVNVHLKAPALPVTQPAAEYAPLVRPYSVPGLGDVMSGAHATARHAQEAEIARGYLQKSGYCQDCADGRTRCVASGAGDFALGVYQVVKGAVVELTAFLCDADYVRRVFDDCADGGDSPAGYSGW